MVSEKTQGYISLEQQISILLDFHEDENFHWFVFCKPVPSAANQTDEK